MLRAMNVTVVVLLFLSTVANAGLVLTLDGVSYLESGTLFSAGHWSEFTLQPILIKDYQAKVYPVDLGAHLLAIEPINLADVYSVTEFIQNPEYWQRGVRILQLYGFSSELDINDLIIPEPASGLFAVVGGAYLCLRNRRRKLSA